MRRTHRSSGTPEHNAWKNLKKRCLNPRDPRYADYGGRGITVCDEWLHDFPAFLAHVGKRPSPEYSIDRVLNSKGYEPGNVKWSTRIEQQNNMRTTTHITAFGKTMTKSQWSRETGLGKTTINWRLENGQTFEQALCPITGRRPSQRKGVQVNA